MYPYSCLFQLHGMMRVILEPLIGDVPIVGAVTMFFIRRPVGTWDSPSLSSTPTISLSISPFLSPSPPTPLSSTPGYLSMPPFVYVLPFLFVLKVLNPNICSSVFPSSLHPCPAETGHQLDWIDQLTGHPWPEVSEVDSVCC